MSDNREAHAPEAAETAPSILEMLLDAENNENIVLHNENGDAIELEQVAVIPVDDKLYAILKPIGGVQGIAADEALVFCIGEEDGDVFIELEMDEEICDIVFQVYYTLLDARN